MTINKLTDKRLEQIARKRFYPTDGEAYVPFGDEVASMVAEIQGYRKADERRKIRIAHAEWSLATFGNVGPVGPLKHLSKEALEAAAAPGDLHEWADMQFLLWDAQRAAGITDEQIFQAMVEKLEINKARQWQKPKDGEPRFHIKGSENDA